MFTLQRTRLALGVLAVCSMPSALGMKGTDKLHSKDEIKNRYNILQTIMTSEQDGSHIEYLYGDGMVARWLPCFITHLCSKKVTIKWVVLAPKKVVVNQVDVDIEEYRYEEKTFDYTTRDVTCYEDILRFKAGALTALARYGVDDDSVSESGPGDNGASTPEPEWVSNFNRIGLLALPFFVYTRPLSKEWGRHAETQVWQWFYYYDAKTLSRWCKGASVNRVILFEGEYYADISYFNNWLSGEILRRYIKLDDASCSANIRWGKTLIAHSHQFEHSLKYAEKNPGAAFFIYDDKCNVWQWVNKLQKNSDGSITAQRPSGHEPNLFLTTWRKQIFPAITTGKGGIELLELN